VPVRKDLDFRAELKNITWERRSFMNDTVIVTTDLGAFKAYRLLRTERQTPRLEIIEEIELVDGHGKLGDKVTDQAGRWKVPASNSKMAMSYGERQKIGLELRRRLIKQVAERLQKLVTHPEVESCFFAASPEVNEQILDEAGPGVRAKIEKNLACNLTNAEKTELLQHFLEPEPARPR
jgi:hypothetical protein